MLTRWHWNLLLRGPLLRLVLDVRPLLLMVSCLSSVAPPRDSCREHRLHILRWLSPVAVPQRFGEPQLVFRAQDVLEHLSCSRALGLGFVNLSGILRASHHEEPVAVPRH